MRLFQSQFFHIIAYWYCLLAPVIPLWKNNLSKEILSRFFLAWGEGCARRVCRKVCRGYVGRYVGRYVRRGVSRVRRKGMSEGYVGAMFQLYVGQVCRKGLSEGLSGGNVGEWLWVRRERPLPQGHIRVTLKAARGHVYICGSVRLIPVCPTLKHWKHKVE